ncbi:MAG: formimidoylglutamate deiminase [Acidocella sp.]|nr:formimidoylglutamate deiminase [Acidocella sp.]
MGSSLFFRHALLPTGWAEDVGISIIDGLISAVTTSAPPPPNAVTQPGIALPGIANLHSHSFQRAISGLTEYRDAATNTANFWTWRDMMYRFALAMDPDDVEAVATLAFIEMLESGFTSVLEFHYLHHAPDGGHYTNIAELSSRIAAAAAGAGIDLTIAPVFYAQGDFAAAPPSPSQRRFISDLDDYETLLRACEPLARMVIAPHSLRAVTPEQLSALTGLVRPGQPIHIHIAEQTAEVEACLAWSGQRPVEWLRAHADVNPQWCLIHATHTTDDERAGIARSGAMVGLCPLTEADLGDGIFPLRDYAGAWGLGSDSNIQISLAAELRMLEYVQRLHYRQRNILATTALPATATAAYQAACAGGAQALAINHGITPGAPANIIALAGDAPDIALAQFVFGGRQLLTDVWVHGTKRVAAGRHNLAAQAEARFNRVLHKILERT